MKKPKYKYLVTFAYLANGHMGIGSRIYLTRKKIRTTTDLNIISGFIEADGNKNPVILNFILLDTIWGFWEWLRAISELALLVYCISYIVASCIAVVFAG